MILVFGANGASGRALLQRLDPANTTAVLRKAPEDGFFDTLGVQTAYADALSANDCAEAVRNSRPQLIVSLVGGKNEQGVRSDAEGNINIIRAAQQHAPDAHIVLVTSMGCGEQYDHMSDTFKQALGEAVLAKTEAENALKNSGLAYTIVRPCGLGDGEDSNFALHEIITGPPSRYMSRHGLAAALQHIIDAPDVRRGKVYSVMSE